MNDRKNAMTKARKRKRVNIMVTFRSRETSERYGPPIINTDSYWGSKKDHWTSPRVFREIKKDSRVFQALSLLLYTHTRYVYYTCLLHCCPFVFSYDQNVVFVWHSPYISLIEYHRNSFLKTKPIIDSSVYDICILVEGEIETRDKKTNIPTREMA